MLGFRVANAGMVNWVVAKVNNEPITNFEVFDTMKKIKTSNQDTALQFLINEKLKASEIKKRDIRVAPYEVTNAIEEIAKKVFLFIKIPKFSKFQGEQFLIVPLNHHQQPFLKVLRKYLRQFQ